MTSKTVDCPRHQLNGLNAWLTLVLFRTRRRDECSRLKEGVRRRVRKSRQKEAAGAADAGLMQIEWSEGEVLKWRESARKRRKRSVRVWEQESIVEDGVKEGAQ